MNRNIIFQANLSDVKQTVKRAWYTCATCGKKIEARWVGNSFDGWFTADASQYSELFDDYLPWIDEVRCTECVTFNVENS